MIYSKSLVSASRDIFVQPPCESENMCGWPIGPAKYPLCPQDDKRPNVLLNMHYQLVTRYMLIFQKSFIEFLITIQFNRKSVLDQILASNDMCYQLSPKCLVP